MNDDYLWDGSGPPDPGIQRLERLLGRLRSTRNAGEFRVKADAADLAVVRWTSARFLAPALAAAAAIVMMVGATWSTVRVASPPSTFSYWPVAAIEGRRDVVEGG